MQEILNKKIVEVETDLNYKVYKKYYCFSLSKSRNYKARPKIIYGLGVLTILFSIFLLALIGFKLIFVSLITIDIIVLLVNVMITTYVPKKNYENNARFYTNPIKYTFFEDNIIVENSNEAAKGTSEVKYESFHKVYELDDAIYMFIDKYHAYIIIKNELCKEKLEQVREILDSKLGKKYYKY